MKEGAREIRRVVHRVAMLPIRQITLDDLYEGRIIKESLAHPVERRSEARNAHGKQDASRSQDPMRFTQCLETAGTFSQVIQGSKQEHDVDTRVSTL